MNQKEIPRFSFCVVREQYTKRCICKCDLQSRLGTLRGIFFFSMELLLAFWVQSACFYSNNNKSYRVNCFRHTTNRGVLKKSRFFYYCFVFYRKIFNAWFSWKWPWLMFTMCDTFFFSRITLLTMSQDSVTLLNLKNQ